MKLPENEEILYTVVEGYSPLDLAKNVNKVILQNDMIPIGGIKTVNFENGSINFIQALVSRSLSDILQIKKKGKPTP